MAATTTTPAKAPITCHILDTSLGQPARNVRVQLLLQQSSSSLPSALPFSPTAPTTTASAASPHYPTTTTHPSSNPVIFESQTDDDGRVKTWLPYSAPQAAGEVPVYTLEDVLGDIRGPSRWTLRFDTEGYFRENGGRETFFPEVCVVFEVQEGQHYHVPLLLSAFGYSTYRGS